ncbi:MAG: Holliday junction branch migration protein RuvA [Holosporaceae bacterium]|jgi:Holliday junction DNA helicase RuvA|nr:Holliday junction branch migration protein RuvA [Holosporaceae bacterium]
MVISHLKGTVEKISDSFIVLDVNGIGYTLTCSARTTGNAENLKNTLLHIFTVLSVREDSWTLFGFSSESERFWFNTLISVQGVGGKAAMAILSVLSDDEIYKAFLTGDKSIFTRADGVGPKLASRIISELKDKVAGKIDVNIPAQQNLVANEMLNDVVSALVNLGYQRSDIFRVVSLLQPEQDMKFDTLLRAALSKLSSGA